MYKVRGTADTILPFCRHATNPKRRTTVQRNKVSSVRIGPRENTRSGLSQHTEKERAVQNAPNQWLSILRNSRILMQFQVLPVSLEFHVANTNKLLPENPTNCAVSRNSKEIQHAPNNSYFLRIYSTCLINDDSYALGHSVSLFVCFFFPTSRFAVDVKYKPQLSEGCSCHFSSFLFEFAWHQFLVSRFVLLVCAERYK